MNRQELYDLIWSEPAKNIAPRLGISDVALSKLCERHEVPQPPRGYWAKKAAGKPVPKLPLPPRGLGISDNAEPGEHHHWSYRGTPDDLRTRELGPRPEFAEPIEEIIARVRKAVGKVSVPRDLSRAHPGIQALLAEDDRRRAAQLAKPYHSIFDASYFESAFEKRRLRILNALILALGLHGCRPTFSRKKDPNDFDYRVGRQTLSITVDEPGYQRSGWRSEKELAKPASTTIKVTIGLRGQTIQTEWQDKGEDRIEDHMAEIVTMAIVAGEVCYRQNEVAHYDWLVERKAQLIKEYHLAEEERQRKERERVEAERKARIEGLLHDAANHRRANDIRDYVSAVRAAGVDVPAKELDRWAQWALLQADDLDPLKGFNIALEPEAPPKVRR